MCAGSIKVSLIIVSVGVDLAAENGSIRQLDGMCVGLVSCLLKLCGAL